MAFKEAVTSYRKEKGWTQKVMAKFLGVSERTYQSIEATGKVAKAEDLERITQLIAYKGGKSENVGKGEKNAANNYVELLTAENLKFRGLLIAKFATIDANLQALNNKVAQLAEKVTGDASAVTLLELKQTTEQLAGMLREELEKELLKP